MIPDHIDFISSYCDRWCERCSMTNRCSAFTAMTAVAMCGDVGDGLELAFGRGADDNALSQAPLVVELLDAHMSPEEESIWSREEDQRRERIEATPIMQTAKKFMHVAHPWLMAHHDTLSSGDDIVREALEIAIHDFMFIRMKLHRALDGKDRRATDEAVGEDPVQNDWNGSAKAALISMVRSADAWSIIASATGMETPAMLASQLIDLRPEVEEAFPDAWTFRRPGFDEHG